MIRDELEAARFVRAALRMIRDEFPDTMPLDATVSGWQHAIGDVIERLEQGAPPWTPERPERAGTWSEVVPGDAVKAPDGQWYAVDATARIGDVVKVRIIVGTDKHVTEQTAAGRVEIRRGPTGQAVDVFAAGGLTLEGIGR